MYFDHCESPTELRKAIGEVLTGTTFVRSTFSGPGAQAITMIGPGEDQILKQAHLEARSVAERLRKRCPTLPALPDAQCLPLEGLCRIGAWCDEAAAKWVQAEQSPKTRELAGEALSEESDDLYGGLDTLRGDICELCNTAFDAATETANFVLEEIYEDTEYETCVKIDEDLTATVTQYEKDAYAAAVSQHERGEIPWARRWDLSKWEVCTHLEPALVSMLENFVTTAKHTLDVARDSWLSSPDTIEILGLLQLTYDKGSSLVSSFSVESFRDYLSFLAERVVLRLEELAAQIKAQGSVSLPRNDSGEKTSGPGHTDEKATAMLPAAEGLREVEIAQIREYADRVAQLLEPMVIPPLERTWESESAGLGGTSEVAQRIAAEWDRVLHPFKVEYRKRVVAVLDDSCWEPIADIFEHYAPQTLGRLDGWRRDILDHTDPGRDRHVYWLESCGEGHKQYGPNPDLKNRLENLAGKLRRRANREEKALTQARAPMGQSNQRLGELDIQGLIEKLKTLRSALDSADQGLTGRARDDLKAYVGSAEQLYKVLQEPLRGSTADTMERLRWVGEARKSRTNTGLYPAILDALAAPGFIAELERWLVQKAKPPSVPPQPPVDNTTKTKLAKEPSKAANQAYLLYTSMGISQEAVAEKMSLQLRRRVKQWQVSRWVNEVRAFRRSAGLPVDIPAHARKTVSVDPSTLNMGRRADGRSAHKRPSDTED